MNKYLVSGPKKNSSQRNERIFNIFTYTLLIVVLFNGVSLLWDHLIDDGTSIVSGNDSLSLNRVREIILHSNADQSKPRNPNCSFWDCLNLYRCDQNGNNRLTVYVYPLQEYVDATSGKLAAPLSSEYYQILEAVVHSAYYTSNPNEACLFLPSIDLLNQNSIEPHLVEQAFAALDYWDSGENHLLINMLPGKNRVIDVNTDRAIILGGGFDTWTYRKGFDVSLPVWSPKLQHSTTPKDQVMNFQKKYLLVMAQLNVLPQHMRVMNTIAEDDPSNVLLLQSCSSSKNPDTASPKNDFRCNVHEHRHEYPHVLSKGTFCLLSRSIRLGQPDLLEILAYNCIPVIAIDEYVLPFDDVIDWTQIAIRVRETELHSVMQKLNTISQIRIFEMQQQGHWTYNRYFKNLRSVVFTALEVLEGRIFPHRSRSINQWNAIDNNYRAAINPLFLPMISPKSQGFTAVILTYDRVQSLFTLIKKLALVPSLQSILVVWNNQRKSPPHVSTYPAIQKPLKVIQTRANKLSNRFYPYAEIETEAILTIDDDIIMLTADELDFGFEVWREFPDRIVGFPSRIHVWDNTTMRWLYESEWTNQISMVLTGAAFHHKFWSHMYTYAMPGDIKDWVDEHMNCEDIAMNFLVANVTKKPPIKVTPRKKFKCPECINTEMLSADLNHMRERSACIDRFARVYGRMPLRSVEFRADPVLFKDNFPEKLKRFNDVGSL